MKKMNDELKPKALIVGVNLRNDKNFSYSIEELKNLVYACNMDVVRVITQNLENINKPYYIGTGKIEDINIGINQYQADIVVFDNELSPVQLRNLEKKLNISILDRTGLILEIFRSRAKTKEAKLQVELAKLEYSLPRLVGLHDSLGRQAGSSTLSNKGSGEKKIELDRRKIENKIYELKKRLDELEKIRNNQKKRRKNSNIPIVALVGYTNAGKSTLMNAYIDTYKKDEDKKVYEENMLFATLDTTVRNIEISENKNILLSDTVGFVSKLPHSLIKAFRSTLNEIKDADLILHVIDYSDEKYEEYEKVTTNTLKEIGVDESIPIIKVYNKSDLMLDRLPLVEDKNTIYISALKRYGIYELSKLIENILFKNYIKCKMQIPFQDGDILSYLNDNAHIINTKYNEQGTLIELECKPQDYSKYKKYVV